MHQPNRGGRREGRRQEGKGLFWGPLDISPERAALARFTLQFSHKPLSGEHASIGVHQAINVPSLSDERVGGGGRGGERGKVGKKQALKHQGRLTQRTPKCGCRAVSIHTHVFMDGFNGRVGG